MNAEITEEQRASAEAMQPWYVIETEPQRETTAAAHLIGRRFRPYLPNVLVEHRAGRTVRKSLRPMFRGYMFLQLDLGRDRDRVYGLPGVRGLLKRPGGGHAVLTGGDISFIKEQEREAVDPDAAKAARLAPFAPDTVVRVVDGPFSSFTGPVWMLDEQERIKVLLDIFGRPTPVQFEPHQIEPL